ncbi:hypothetical protein BKD30_01045 [Tersicoccus phoenicis]|uniref:Uncharacterized protein n=1 Tax=Tersicoccus phoenicis TaxID=554083 RepID=A0A1R1LP32_9MICC|nr:hypothetical protein [Tersicoccus phoenicis]OMH29307.1 hypothetical protein BKD30_01045 [Tersicoccus phoenicis]
MSDDVIAASPDALGAASGSADLPVVRDIFSASRPRSAGSTFLAPLDVLPELGTLPLRDLQVLHSRVARQREREYMTLDGPHPVTLDRLDELTRALDAREQREG